MPDHNDSPPSGPYGSHAEPRTAAVTLRTLQRMAEAGTPFSCLACYDAISAKICHHAGVHVLLLGDSAAQIVLGQPSTIHMPLELAIAMTAGLKRGAPSALIMGDMPFMSYQGDDADALTNAARFMTEGLADVVKIEADASFAPLVRKMTRAGIPVCAHIGLKPQAVGLEGGYRAQGRTEHAAQRLVDDAVALERAGAVLLLIEAVPPEASRRVVDATSVPVIGIGAGDDTHGQILVLHDLVGLNAHPPGFVSPTATMHADLRDAVAEWVHRVANRETGGRRYTMKDPGHAPNKAPDPAPRHAHDAPQDRAKPDHEPTEHP